MLGISDIGIYIPEEKRSNADFLNEKDMDSSFVDKIGIEYVSRKSSHEDTSDLCVYAFNDLLDRTSNNNITNRIDCICVCTQNGDYALPHTSAVVQNKLKLSNDMASFDLNLGCSGYVYGISLMKHFMQANGLECGLFFTSDPYSKIIDEEDKNTVMLFGDAATVTLIDSSPLFSIGTGSFSTYGEKHESLIKKKGAPLVMDGREVFTFSMRHVPPNIKKCLALNACRMEDIDTFMLHQANKYMIQSLIKTMKLPEDKVPFGVVSYGNTVSSSIPILLQGSLSNEIHACILLCGFGVGLSISSTVIRRV